ncbi:MAG: MORN motif-containing protein [Sodalinema sp.]|uniref:MORN repeat-containing protein n=1 Tax=Sodalinema sp. TaxID=3080550 RepID=UPI0012079512|nr:MAG: MORN motif-containing protein [Phormidium sp. SL48-SHIP]
MNKLSAVLTPLLGFSLWIGVLPLRGQAQEDIRDPQCDPAFLLDTGSGYGRCNYGEGRSYIGSFSDFLPNGRGILTLVDGTRYEGEFKDGLPDGRGRLIRPDDSRYEGIFREGAIREGTAFYTNGDRYEGSFSGVPRTENVTTLVPVGTTLQGEPILETEQVERIFFSSQPDGDGRYVFANGNRFEGEFFAGQPFGRGTFRHSTGTTCTGFFYTTNFDANNATCTYGDGRRYVGELRQGRPHGTGTMRFPDGRQVVGAFRDGQPVSFSGYN